MLVFGGVVRKSGFWVCWPGDGGVEGSPVVRWFWVRSRHLLNSLSSGAFRKTWGWQTGLNKKNLWCPSMRMIFPTMRMTFPTMRMIFPSMRMIFMTGKHWSISTLSCCVIICFCGWMFVMVLCIGPHDETQKLPGREKKTHLQVLLATSQGRPQELRHPLAYYDRIIRCHPFSGVLFHFRYISSDLIRWTQHPMLLRSVQWWPGSKRAQKQALVFGHVADGLDMGRVLKRGGSPKTKRKHAIGNHPWVLGERIYSKKTLMFFFLFQNFWCSKKVIPWSFCFRIWTFFFWDVWKNLVVLGSASGAVAPIFPWLSMKKWTCQWANGGWIRCLPSKDPI